MRRALPAIVALLVGLAIGAWAASIRRPAPPLVVWAAVPEIAQALQAVPADRYLVPSADAVAEGPGRRERALCAWARGNRRNWPNVERAIRTGDLTPFLVQVHSDAVWLGDERVASIAEVAAGGSMTTSLRTLGDRARAASDAFTHVHMRCGAPDGPRALLAADAATPAIVLDRIREALNEGGIVAVDLLVRADRGWLVQARDVGVGVWLVRMRDGAAPELWNLADEPVGPVPFEGVLAAGWPAHAAVVPTPRTPAGALVEAAAKLSSRGSVDVTIASISWEASLDDVEPVGALDRPDTRSWSEPLPVVPMTSRFAWTTEVYHLPEEGQLPLPWLSPEEAAPEP